MKKSELIEVLERIRMNHMCAYISPDRCDCKFSEPSMKLQYEGYGFKRGSENNNGCPEMRVIIDFIERLPDIEL